VVGIIIGAVVIVAGVLGYRAFDRSRAEREAVASVEVTAPAGSAESVEAGPPLEVPLDASDGWARALAAGLSTHPMVASWLATDGLIRRFVVATSNLAHGVSPRSHLGFMVPPTGPSVQPSGDRMHLDPASFRRYDALTNAFVSLNTERVAETYNRLLPLFEEAHRELGLREPFDDVAARAVGRLLAVQVPQGPIEVISSRANFVFADPALEALTPAAKHLVRAGPDNALRIQAKIRDIAAELGIEPEVPTGGTR
jgi:hypothetical protein